MRAADFNASKSCDSMTTEESKRGHGLICALHNMSRHDKRSSFSLTWGQAANYWMLTSIDPVSQKLFQSRHWYWYYPTLRRHEFNPKDLGNLPCGALGSDSSRKRHCCQVFQTVSSDALSTIVPSWHFSNKTIKRIKNKIKTGSWLNNPTPGEGQGGEKF